MAKTTFIPTKAKPLDIQTIFQRTCVEMFVFTVGQQVQCFSLCHMDNKTVPSRPLTEFVSIAVTQVEKEEIEENFKNFG